MKILNKILRKRVTLYLFLSIALLFSCSNIAEYPVRDRDYTSAPEGGKVTIVILNTSDEHGHLFDYDYIKNKPVNYGLVKIAAIVKKIRKEYKNVLLISGGDILQGTSLNYYHNYVDNRPVDPMVSAMNYIGYDCMSVGNHDIEQGLKRFNKARRESEFPWLSANSVYEKNLQMTYFQPYLIKEIGGVRIGILGMTTPAIPLWLNKEVYRGIKFLDMVESARKWAVVLREKEKVDLLVGLFHSGYAPGEEDISSSQFGNIPPENAVHLVAGRVDGIDYIACGHTHRVAPSIWTNGVLICHPGAHARSIGKAIFTFKEKDGRWELTLKRSELLLTDDVKTDEKMKNEFLSYHEKVKNHMKKKIGYTTKDMAALYAYFKDTAIIDLIQRAQLEYTKADFSLAACFDISSTMEKGDITVSDIAGLYIYENFIYVRELSGQMIKDWLEYSSRFFNSIDSNGRGLISGNLKGYNYDIFQGIDYKIDLSEEPGNRIKDLKISKTGKLLDLKKTYKVALNNYRSNGGGGHLKAANAVDSPLIFKSGKAVRDILIEYVQKHKRIDIEPDNNWELLPGEKVSRKVDVEIKMLREDAYQR